MLSLKTQPWIEVSGLVCIGENMNEKLRFRFKGKSQRKYIQLFASHELKNFDISNHDIYQQAQKVAKEYIDGSLSVEYVPGEPDSGIEQSHTLYISGWTPVHKMKYSWANEQIDWFLNNGSDSVDNLGGIKAIHHLSR